MAEEILAQYFTKRYDYILQGMTPPPEHSLILEPFCGEGDLLNFLPKELDYKILEYDISPTRENTIQRDTIGNPPDYKNTFVLTNPPYVSRNKNPIKDMYNLYGVNDLYKCFLKELISQTCLGGIIVIPLNFWCSMRAMDVRLRKEFFEVFTVDRVNVFEEQVFEDTSYTVCSIQFRKRQTFDEIPVPVFIFPSACVLRQTLNEYNRFTIGGEIFSLVLNDGFVVERLTSKTVFDSGCVTNILGKCIDAGGERIGMKLVTDENRYTDTTKDLTARTYLTLVISPPISMETQTVLVEAFNEFLERWRRNFHSLFLSHYRENSRKRISFQLVYNIVRHLLV